MHDLSECQDVLRAFEIDNGKFNSYMIALILLWQEASRSDHVPTRKSVKSKLEKTINLYYTNACNKAHRKRSKHPLKNENVSAISIWKLNHMWRLQTLSKSGPVTGSSLDIGKNMHQLIGHEKIFLQGSANKSRMQVK